MTGAERLREALRRALDRPLPGLAAHRLAWPEDLPGRLEPPDAATYGAAAVLVALHAGSAEGAPIFFPLIRRPAGIGHHSGQIALPGGRCDPAEDPCSCALREAEEEIGLARAAAEILGALTPVPVSVSRNRIQPMVAWMREPDLADPSLAGWDASSGIAPDPSWRPQAGEVESILVADPDRLAREGPRRTAIRLRDGSERFVPAWTVSAPDGPAIIWGATAIVLAEFLAVWLQARQECP